MTSLLISGQWKNRTTETHNTYPPIGIMEGSLKSRFLKKYWDIEKYLFEKKNILQLWQIKYMKFNSINF